MKKLLLTLTIVTLSGCADGQLHPKVAPSIKTAVEVAQALCASDHVDGLGVSFEKARAESCSAVEQYGPWLELAAQSKEEE